MALVIVVGKAYHMLFSWQMYKTIKTKYCSAPPSGLVQITSKSFWYLRIISENFINISRVVFESINYNHTHIAFYLN